MSMPYSYSIGSISFAECFSHVTSGVGIAGAVRFSPNLWLKTWSPPGKPEQREWPMSNDVVDALQRIGLRATSLTR
jgi:hypothetical protein